MNKNGQIILPNGKSEVYSQVQQFYKIVILRFALTECAKVSLGGTLNCVTADLNPRAKLWHRLVLQMLRRQNVLVGEVAPMPNSFIPGHRLSRLVQEEQLILEMFLNGPS